MTTELWSPRSRTWRLGPPQREFRTYHSTALLLPDGRVVSAGDDFSGRFTGADATRNFTQDSAEIFEPPYLFDGNRKAPAPEAARRPKRVGWNKQLRLGVKAARKNRPVTKAVLIAPSAVTHAVDMNQRYVPLRVTRKRRGSITVRTPANSDIALPGYYMLFVIDRSGTPSVAPGCACASRRSGSQCGRAHTWAHDRTLCFRSWWPSRTSSQRLCRPMSSVVSWAGARPAW